MLNGECVFDLAVRMDFEQDPDLTLIAKSSAWNSTSSSRTSTRMRSCGWRSTLRTSCSGTCSTAEKESKDMKSV